MPYDPFSCLTPSSEAEVKNGDAHCWFESTVSFKTFELLKKKIRKPEKAELRLPFTKLTVVLK